MTRPSQKETGCPSWPVAPSTTLEVGGRSPRHASGEERAGTRRAGRSRNPVFLRTAGSWTGRWRLSPEHAHTFPPSQVRLFPCLLNSKGPQETCTQGSSRQWLPVPGSPHPVSKVSVSDFLESWRQPHLGSLPSGNVSREPQEPRLSAPLTSSTLSPSFISGPQR